MSLKMEFVRRATADGANVSALCREYNITRQTGHKWISRFNESGCDGLEERSRRPRNTPLATGEDLVVAIVESREAHPTWGPRKLRHVLARRFGEQTPTERTIARVLNRFDKVRRRKRRPPLNIVSHSPVVNTDAPNDVWTVDYKGWWRARNGERCEPLTVRDAYSRFILAIEVLSGTNGTDARKAFMRLFKRYGLPKAIQCDNGSPFIAVRARAGLSQLSAWWIALGIKVIRSRPGCPQDNGAHERMHADMAKEIQVVPCDSRVSQQQACSKWRQEFNHVRPHNALSGKTPAELYKPSKRRMCKRVAFYPVDWLVRKVDMNGKVRICGELYFVSGALSGYHVGLQPVDALHWRVWFFDIDLETIEVAPTEMPEKLLKRAANLASMPTCSNASSVRARSKRAPATPRLTRSARVSQSQVSKARPTQRSHSKKGPRR
jgi:putative transposase